jgi:tetratricopeptide (TPR) repeat protein
MRYVLVMLVLSASVLLPATNQTSAGPELASAEKLYRHTDYQAAIELLAALPEKTAPVIELTGRCYLMMGEYKKSSELLERAAALEPDNSMYRLWLGRVYGRRAESAFAVAAVGLATKARVNLEKAVELDPHNTEAIVSISTSRLRESWEAGSIKLSVSRRLSVNATLPKVCSTRRESPKLEKSSAPRKSICGRPRN